jgi:HPt (histidine-containing phosphotransfer) domain-containing protein
MFIADANQRVDELRAALASHDDDAVAQSAHTLSGSAANMGATELARLCATLSRPQAADPTNSDAVFVRIEAELRRVESALLLVVAP